MRQAFLRTSPFRRPLPRSRSPVAGLPAGPGFSRWRFRPGAKRWTRRRSRASRNASPRSRPSFRSGEGRSPRRERTSSRKRPGGKPKRLARPSNPRSPHSSTAERELAAAAREGGERARETEEGLAETEALLDRAVLFRDAVDLAFGALTSSAAAVYGDFRRGLAEASRAILESWRVPWAALEFGDDLSVSAVAADGRTFTQAEIDGAFSTGAREQLHLTARLAVLRYLGAGGTGVPLLLDDPLTGTDDERFAAVMEFLISRVLPERPVLLVSCHLWRHERLRAALPPSSAGRLAVVRLPGPVERAAV